MAKVEELSTADQREGADAAEALTRYTGPPVPEPGEAAPFLIQFYRSAICKKWLMAISGIVLMGYVLAHMIGNLKVFLGKGEINAYADWLRTLGEPAAPRTVVLWILRHGDHHRLLRAHRRRVPADPDEPAGAARRSTSRRATTRPPTSRRARCAGPASSSACS